MHSFIVILLCGLLLNLRDPCYVITFIRRGSVIDNYIYYPFVSVSVMTVVKIRHKQTTAKHFRARGVYIIPDRQFLPYLQEDTYDYMNMFCFQLQIH